MANRTCTLIGTHNGLFHYDEIVAVGLLSILHNNKISVIRTRDPQKLSTCNICVDVGHGKFDHHMPGGNGQRENSFYYASCGLVWKEYGHEILKKFECPPEIVETCFKAFDDTVILPVDKIDNGIPCNSYFEFISFFLPPFNKESDVDSYFNQALQITTQILKSAIVKCIDKVRCDTILNECIKNHSNSTNILEIPSQFLNWQPAIISYNKTSNCCIDFVVFPYLDGGYAAQCVPPSSSEIFNQRISFPKEWAGQTNDLPKLTGVKSATFCHNNCFFVRAMTRDDIILLCQLATEFSKNS